MLFLPCRPAAPPTSSPSARGKFTQLFLNTTACYLLAWLLVNFISQATQVVMARRSYVPGNWDLGGMRFTLGGGAWRRDTVRAAGRGLPPGVFNENEALPYPTHVAWGLALPARHLVLGTPVAFR